MARGRLRKAARTKESLFDQERGTRLKKWKGLHPVALLYPNRYSIGVSSLGFQLVYELLNRRDNLVCERFFLPEPGEPLRSFESQRPLRDFPLVFYSISFEHDYLNLIRLLSAGGIPLYASDRSDALISAENPLIVGGGVVTFMNPEPLAPFTDLFLLGEAEAMLDSFLDRLERSVVESKRQALLLQLQQAMPSLYVPGLYAPSWDTASSRQTGIRPEAPSIPDRIQKSVLVSVDTAAHSTLLSPAAEFSNLYVTELGRGCSRGCRFCAAGFIYRPPRLWDADSVVRGLAERAESVRRIGLLGMEMADEKDLERLSAYLLESGCSLSFSSLRADRIAGPLLELLSNSELKSVAIAPDGASERLRSIINKNLSESDILRAAERLVDAGLFKLKLYLMIGLPGETYDDLQEMIELIKKVKARMMPAGRKRGRLCEISLSVNCFAPKPWTPFQFYPFAGVKGEAAEQNSAKKAIKVLKEKIAFLKKGIAKEANVRMKHDKPDTVLFQAILARGDRRLAPVLTTMATEQIPWQQAMRKHDLAPDPFVFTEHGGDDFFPWMVVDHKIEQKYLWHEYQKSFEERTTVACDTAVCRRCGVCGD